MNKNSRVSRHVRFVENRLEDLDPHPYKMIAGSSASSNYDWSTDSSFNPYLPTSSGENFEVPPLSGKMARKVRKRSKNTILDSDSDNSEDDDDDDDVEIVSVKHNWQNSCRSEAKAKSSETSRNSCSKYKKSCLERQKKRQMQRWSLNINPEMDGGGLKVTEEKFEDTEHSHFMPSYGEDNNCTPKTYRRSSTPKSSARRKNYEDEYDPENDLFVQGVVPVQCNFKKLKKEIDKLLSSSDSVLLLNKAEKMTECGEKNASSCKASATPSGRSAPVSRARKRTPKVSPKKIKRTKSVPLLSDITVTSPELPRKCETSAHSLQTLLAARETLRKLAQDTNNFTTLTKATPNPSATSTSCENQDMKDTSKDFKNDSDLPPTQPYSETILKDVVAYVDVIFGDEDRSWGVKTQLSKLGATVVKSFTKETPVTHVIFHEGHISTYKKAVKRNIPLVSLMWVEECRKTGLRISERLFPAENIEEYESPGDFLKKLRKRRRIIYPERLMSSPKPRRVKRRVAVIESVKPTEDNVTPLRPQPQVPEWVKEVVGEDRTLHFLLQKAEIKKPSDFRDLVINSPEVDELEVITPLALRLLRKIIASRRRNLAQEITEEGQRGSESKSGCEPVTCFSKNLKYSEKPYFEESKNVHFSARENDRFTEDGRSDPKCSRLEPVGHSIGKLESSQQLSGKEPKNVCISDKTDDRINEEGRSDPKCSNYEPVSHSIGKFESSQQLFGKEPKNVNISDGEDDRITKEGRSDPKCSKYESVSHCIGKFESSQQLSDKEPKNVSISNKTDDRINEEGRSDPKCSNYEPVSHSIGKFELSQQLFGKEPKNVNISDGEDDRITKEGRSDPKCSKYESVSHCIGKFESSQQLSDKEPKNVNISYRKDDKITEDKSDMKYSKYESVNHPIGKLESGKEPESVKMSDRKDDKSNKESKSDLKYDNYEQVRHSIQECELSQQLSVKESESVNISDRKYNRITEEGKSDPKCSSNHELLSYSTALSEIELSQQLSVKEPLSVNISDRKDDQVSSLKIQNTRDGVRKTSKRKLLPLNKEHPVLDIDCDNNPSPRREVGDSKGKSCVSTEKEENKGRRFIVRRSRRSSIDFLQRKCRPTGSFDERPPGIVCTLLRSRDVSRIEFTIMKLGKFVLEHNISPRTTHIVSNGNGRTMKLLKGMINGCWIVSKEWVLRSLEEGRWIDEEEYEMKDTHPSVTKYRLDKMSFGPLFKPDIFSKCGPIFVSSMYSVQRADLSELVMLCGGSIVQYTSQAAIVVGTYLPGVTCVRMCWVLDSVTDYICKPVEEYSLEL